MTHLKSGLRRWTVIFAAALILAASASIALRPSEAEIAARAAAESATRADSANRSRELLTDDEVRAILSDD